VGATVARIHPSGVRGDLVVAWRGGLGCFLLLRLLLLARVVLAVAGCSSPLLSAFASAAFLLLGPLLLDRRILAGLFLASVGLLLALGLLRIAFLLLRARALRQSALRLLGGLALCLATLSRRCSIRACSLAADVLDRLDLVSSAGTRGTTLLACSGGADAGARRAAMARIFAAASIAGSAAT
jgi:hypothetical protein